jgi:hypothetical protein
MSETEFLMIMKKSQTSRASRRGASRRRPARGHRPSPGHLDPLHSLGPALVLALLLLLPDSGVGSFDPWCELGLQRHATTQQVRAAYLRRARQLHPDKNREDKARGANKEERFKRVLRAYEEITASHANPQAATAPPQDTAARPASGARRAGSMPSAPPTDPRDAQHASGQRQFGCGVAGRACVSEAFDMRVFTDTVALEDMEEDANDEGLAYVCRCSGHFVLPWDQLEHAWGRAAVNCQLCSLWIWVVLNKNSAQDSASPWAQAPAARGHDMKSG